MGCCRLPIFRRLDECTVDDTDSGGDKVCAGVCVVCPAGVLLTQSHGLYWGIPKGILEQNESIRQCALRELREETGVVLTPDSLERHVFSFRYSRINRKIVIFFHVTDTVPEIGRDVSEDSTGAGFIHPVCLRQMERSRKLSVNYFTRFLINELFFGNRPEGNLVVLLCVLVVCEITAAALASLALL